MLCGLVRLFRGFPWVDLLVEAMILGCEIRRQVSRTVGGVACMIYSEIAQSDGNSDVQMSIRP